MAASVDSNSVLLTWTPSPNDSSPRFQSYKLFWTYAHVADSSRAKSDSVELPRGTSSHVVTGLTNGVEYFFMLSVLPTDLALQVFPTIRWAPATNYGTVTLPQQAFLALYDSTSNPPGPSVIGMENLTQAQMYGDIYLDTSSVPSTASLKSASMKGIGWRQTWFSTMTIPASDPTQPRPSFPSISSFTDSVVYLQQPQMICYCKTQDGHYARIYVHWNPMAASSPFIRVELDVSYQSSQNLPYAKRSQK